MYAPGCVLSGARIESEGRFRKEEDGEVRLEGKSSGAMWNQRIDNPLESPTQDKRKEYTHTGNSGNARADISSVASDFGLSESAPPGLQRASSVILIALMVMAGL